MENDLHVKSPDDHGQVVIDIRKILVQLGIDPQRWPSEWRDTMLPNTPI
jgi:hypothetical protein